MPKQPNKASVVAQESLTYVRLPLPHQEQLGLPFHEKLALTFFIFVLLMALGFFIAAIHGYVEMRGVWA